MRFGDVLFLSNLKPCCYSSLCFLRFGDVLFLSNLKLKPHKNYSIFRFGDVLFLSNLKQADTGSGVSMQLWRCVIFE